MTPGRAAWQAGAPALEGDMQDTMAAIRIHQYGGPEVVVVDEVACPTPGPGEVLVRCSAWGVNPVDRKVRAGMVHARLPLEMPALLGCDLAGVVAEDAAGFKAGERVYAMTGLFGAFSERVAVKAEHLARAPATLDDVQAAAVPLAALTAWQAFMLAGVRPGQTVLVLAAGGGVGGFAVQIARTLGARVYATASADKLDYVRDLGAEAVIDYRVTALDAFAGVDVVFDLVGGETQDAAWTVLKPGGFLVSAVAVPGEGEIAAKGLRGARVGVRANGEQLRGIAALIDEGRVRVHVEATYPFAEASAAIERVAAGHTRGKIVLTAPPSR